MSDYHVIDSEKVKQISTEKGMSTSDLIAGGMNHVTTYDIFKGQYKRVIMRTVKKLSGILGVKPSEIVADRDELIRKRDTALQELTAAQEAGDQLKEQIYRKKIEKIESVLC